MRSIDFFLVFCDVLQLYFFKVSPSENFFYSNAGFPTKWIKFPILRSDIKSIACYTWFYCLTGILFIFIVLHDERPRLKINRLMRSDLKRAHLATERVVDYVEGKFRDEYLKYSSLRLLPQFSSVIKNVCKSILGLKNLKDKRNKSQ